MVFSSHLFAFYYLPLALAVYYLLPRGARHLALTALSYLFYGWSNPAFTLLMMTSTVVDYACGLYIARGGRWRAEAHSEALGEASLPAGQRNARQRRAVAVSVITNLSLLGFFKYFDFAVESYEGLVTALGLSGLAWETTLRVTLPLGISFYTFQSMSYTIDVYRGEAPPLESFVDFACYVSLFPQLVAGPIIRYNDVADQLRSRTHSLDKIARGTALFCLGMGKKVLLANPCGAVADVAFGAGSLEAGDAWLGLLAYAMQIYFDFSGYSDMAIGLGLMLGFCFPKNFDSPYRSASITEFWRRWHVSLSSWLRDYLYIPLGGNRLGRLRTYVNLFLVMLLGGLWHGAAWNFVVWGGYHGVLLAAERHRREQPPLLPRPLRVASTGLLVLLGWVLFRARDLGHAVDYYEALFAQSTPTAAASLVGGLVVSPWSLIAVSVSTLVALGAPQAWDWTQRLSWWRASAAATVLFAALLAMETQGYNPFIYFVF